MTYSYGVITPTIPEREALLRRCVESVQRQRRANVKHFICGDGFTPNTPGAEGTPERLGVWGHPIRNLMIERHADEVDRLLFINDDDLLLPGALDAYDALPQDVVIARMIEHVMGAPELPKPARIFPLTDRAFPAEGNVGCSMIAVASKVAKRCKFGLRYAGDWDFISEAIKIAGRYGVSGNLVAIWSRNGVRG